MDAPSFTLGLFVGAMTVILWIKIQMQTILDLIATIKTKVLEKIAAGTDLTPIKDALDELSLAVDNT